MGCLGDHLGEEMSDRLTWTLKNDLPDLPAKRTVEELQEEYISQRWARLFEWVEEQDDPR